MVRKKIGWCACFINLTVFFFFCMHVFFAKGKNVSTHILVNEEHCPVALLSFGQDLDVRHLTLDYFGKQKSSWSA